MVGQADNAAQEQYGKIFAKYMELDNTFFVISSDFCHWGDNFDYQPYDKSCGEIYQYIEKLDKTGASHIENHDPKAFNDYIKQTENTICGRYPIAIYLNAIRQSSLATKTKTKLVQYAQSSQVTKDGKNGSSSVSYATFITYLEG